MDNLYSEIKTIEISDGTLWLSAKKTETGSLRGKDLPQYVWIEDGQIISRCGESSDSDAVGFSLDAAKLYVQAFQIFINQLEEAKAKPPNPVIPKTEYWLVAKEGCYGVQRSSDNYIVVFSYRGNAQSTLRELNESGSKEEANWIWSNSYNGFVKID